MLKPVFSILFFWIVSTSLANTEPLLSENKLSRENFILILNSYSYENAWGTALTKQLQKEIKAIDPELIPRAVYARLDKQQSFLSSRLQMQGAFTKGRISPKIIRPRILILVGEESWMLYRVMNLRGLWEKIPVILCGVHPRILSDYADFFKAEGLTDSGYISTPTSIKQLPVTGVMKADVSLKNLELLLHLYPQLQEIIYLTTGSFSDEFELEQLRTTARQAFPDLQISVYNSNKIHADTICQKINSLPTQRKVVLFNTIPAFLTSLSVPTFSLQDQDVSAEPVLGGYYPSIEQYAQQTTELFKQIYEGKKTDLLPFTYVENKKIHLNSQLLYQRGLYSFLNTMENAQLYNIPPPFLIRHQRPLLLGLLGLLIIGFLYRYYRRIQLYNLHIRESLNRYKTLYKEYDLIFKNMPVSMLVFDENGYLLQYNFSPKLQCIFPVLHSSSEQLLTLNLFDHIRESFLRTKIRNKEIVNSLIVLHPPTDLAATTLQKKKYYFRFLVRYLPGENAGSNQTLIVLIDNQEIYEGKSIRRKLTQALDFAMNKVSIGVANYDLRKQKCHFTSNWLKNLDLDAVPDTLTDAYRNLSAPDQRSLIDFLQDTRPNRPLHYRKEFSVLHRDGRLHWLSYQIGITGYQQETGGFIFTEISQNIDRAKAMEEELYNAMLKAQRSEKLKNAFIANMGHEIRTPLNAIVGFSNLLNETDDLEKRQEMVHQIEENNEILLRLIHDIIDLSKIESGTMDFTFSPTDLTDLFNDMAILAKMKTSPENIKINCEFPEEHYCILTDKVRLKQVLTNFIGNAVKFTSQGSITLGYRLQANELYGYVSDTGIGISPEKQKKIFERFFRENKNYKGFGLGLSISQSIIEGLQGEIGVESKVGLGAKFWFRLPIQEVSLTAQAQTETPAKQSNSLKEKQSILVVEDNESNFLLLQFILQSRYYLIHAWDGEEAIELFHSHPPDLILMDIKMPKKNGYEVTREIRKFSSTVPIIATTAYALSKDEEKVLVHGFDGYLAKPLQKQALLDTLNYWLTRSAS
ncbi:sensor histidine kinase [Odoribacter laneus]|jgi:hypothetical protein|uniref:response regulator n=1 Tax=Odoribacter laneus TaxID=626933 RepID=UPI00189BAF43|nr:response regulator [Odoribacter laneus]GKI20822.1 sensor histidine kinase [Odoribacter laneus]GKI24086.1 sensor histidine kinase [Odoribacter laneus]